MSMSTMSQLADFFFSFFKIISGAQKGAVGIKFGPDKRVNEAIVVSDVYPVNNSILLMTLVINLLIYLKSYLF